MLLCIATVFCLYPFREIIFELRFVEEPPCDFPTSINVKLEESEFLPYY